MPNHPQQTSPTPPPTVFVGSSSEGNEISRAVHANLCKAGLNATHWADAFPLGSTNIESLIEATQNHDYAVYIYRADDEIMSRNITAPAPRDNILFEIGLFTGAIGRNRTFIVYDADNKPKKLSNLDGVCFAPYRSSTNRNISIAVSGACNDIWNHIQSLERDFMLKYGDGFTDDDFADPGPEWHVIYHFLENGRLWEGSKAGLDITRGPALYWLGHDILWTIIALLTNQDFRKIRRGLTGAAWQLEQIGLPYHTLYATLRKNAQRADEDGYWTKQRRLRLAKELFVTAHQLGEVINGHVISYGPKGYKPLPPRPESEAVNREFE